jgi:two-component system cell cycle sensor histidine kinase/response regulator CckA
MCAKGASKAYLIDGKYAIAHLVDLGHLRTVFEKFTKATGFTIGILDHPGLNILISTGWRDICTKFHRPCPATATNCAKSNRHLFDQLDEPGKLAIEQCGNGLVDCAIPIIVKGKHIATLATGQILLEEPDIERFKRQAKLFGFDEQEYLEALKNVPIISQERVKDVTAFLGEMALIISQLGYSNLLINEKAARLENEIARREQSEEALRKSEKSYRLLADNVSDVIWTRDMNLRFTYLSPSVTRLTGYTVEEAMAKPVEETYTPASLGLAMKALAEELAMEERPDQDPNRTRILELEGYCKDGSTRWNEAKMSFLRAEDGRPVGIMGISRDITERKRADKALRESMELFRLTFQTSPDAININRLEDGMFVNINDAFTRLTGFTRKDVIGKTSLSLHIWHNPADRKKLIRGLRENGFFSNLEARFRRKDGSVGYGLMSANVILLHDVPHIISVTRDISDRKEAEEALRQSEARFREMANLLPQVICETNAQGTLTYANRYAFDLFGFTSKDFEMGLNLSQMLIPEDRDRAAGAIGRILERGSSASGLEYRALRKDGSSFPVEIHFSPIIREGSAVGLRGVVVDMTERRKAEEERYRLQAQLLQAQKMESVGTLAGGIAHDFNNLLQAIMGYTQMIMIDKVQGDRDLVELGEIEQAARKASQLTKQLLTFSRKVESKLTPVDLNQVVRQVQELIKRAIPKMIDIELHLQEQGLKVINADPAQMEQILMNLSVNARDAMPDGGKLVIETGNTILEEEFCKTHLGAVPGEYVLLTVSDTGQGMDKQTLEHIFEPFYTTKEIGRGTGLGLSMVYGIVKSHGGYIICDSNQGKGTTFRIYCPAIEAGSTEEEAEREVEGEISGGNKTILLVDDEGSLRDLGKKMLETFGYTVLLADTGESAIEIYREMRKSISLVILDLIMPGMGGTKCLEELHSIDSEVKVVIASGYSVNASTRETLDAVAKGFISKPYELRQMLKMVREVLDQGRM